MPLSLTLPRLLSSFLLCFTLAAYTLLLSPLPTEASFVPCGNSTDDPSTTYNETAPCTPCHLILGIQKIILWMRNVMTAIAITVIVAMGILYIVSTGNDQLMNTAKQGITASLIGFAIILLAWLIVNVIFNLPIFNRASGIIPTSWNTFTCDTASSSRATPIASAPSITPITQPNTPTPNQPPVPLSNPNPSTNVTLSLADSQLYPGDTTTLSLSGAGLNFTGGPITFQGLPSGATLPQTLTPNQTISVSSLVVPGTYTIRAYQNGRLLGTIPLTILGNPNAPIANDPNGPGPGGPSSCTSGPVQPGPAAPACPSNEGNPPFGLVGSSDGRYSGAEVQWHSDARFGGVFYRSTTDSSQTGNGVFGFNDAYTAHCVDHGYASAFCDSTPYAKMALNFNWLMEHYGSEYAWPYLMSGEENNAGFVDPRVLVFGTEGARIVNCFDQQGHYAPSPGACSHVAYNVGGDGYRFGTGDNVITLPYPLGTQTDPTPPLTDPVPPPFTCPVTAPCLAKDSYGFPYDNSLPIAPMNRWSGDQLMKYWLSIPEQPDVEPHQPIRYAMERAVNALRTGASAGDMSHANGADWFHLYLVCTNSSSPGACLFGGEVGYNAWVASYALTNGHNATFDLATGIGTYTNSPGTTVQVYPASGIPRTEYCQPGAVCAP